MEKRIVPSLRALRARKRRTWESIVVGEQVEIMVDLGKAFALEVRGSERKAAAMWRNADLAVTAASGAEIVGTLTMKDAQGSKFPSRKCVIRNGEARLEGPEWYCEHSLEAHAPF